jgi:hypothetical protein
VKQKGLIITVKPILIWAILIMLSGTLTLFWCGARVYKQITFNIDCTGHLKRAADANTIELATQEMKTSVEFLTNNGLTSGYTSIVYKTPDEDVGFWYNLKSALSELEKVNPEASQLEKSNVLMKLRETILDSKDRGVEVTEPYGISIYPHNTSYCILIISSLLSLCISITMLVIKL